MNHTGGHMIVIHIDIMSNYEGTLQNCCQTCQNALKQLYQSNLLGWQTPQSENMNADKVSYRNERNDNVLTPSKNFSGITP